MFSKKATKFGFCAVPLLLVLTGCRRPAPRSASVEASATPAADVQPARVQFTDVSGAAGLKFKHNNGAFGERLMPESVGSGAAFIDYDGDGDQDIFLVNSRDWTKTEVDAYKSGRNRRGGHPMAAPQAPRASTGALYLNNGSGTFSDVTAGSGLDVAMFGMGASVGDYDNDGRPDLYVTALDRNYLFHNEHKTGAGPRFVEVARQSGVRGTGWSTSAAWLDYDKDGKLDLFVCRYIQWTPALDVYASADGKRKSYTGPLSYQSQTSFLYHNEDNGRFEDVSQRAGISRAQGNALGVAVCDYNGDGWPDLIVTNDQKPNFLFRNKGNGTFAEVAVETGIAYSEAGKARAGMGVDVADIDHSGRDSIIIGNYSDEMLGLYQNRGGLFSDVAPRSAVGQASLKFLTFGCVFLDIDNDGWLDIFAANGHVDDDERNLRSGGVSYRQRPLLFVNQGRGQFREVGLQSGKALAQAVVARGLAIADIDLDGDVDVLMTVNGGAPLLLRNDGGSRNGAVRLVLQGRKSNRSGLGAQISVQAGDQTMRRMVRSGSSYLSASELPLTLGLGPHRQADISIQWPSGATTRLKDVQAGQSLLVDESKGIVARRPLAER